MRRSALRALALVLVALALLALPAHAVVRQPSIGSSGPTIATRPTTYHLAPQTYTTTYLAAQGIVGFLISASGPNWSLNECYDAAYGGTKRQVPSDAHSLAAGSWPGGYTPLSADGDWCTVRTRPGDGGTQADFYLETDAAAALKEAACPNDDMPVGGADASPPGFAATCHGSALGGTVTVATGNGTYSCEADASHVSCLVNIGGTYALIHYGEQDGCKSGDTRCYALWALPAVVQANYASGAPLRRISATDGTTLLSSCYASYGGSNAAGAPWGNAASSGDQSGSVAAQLGVYCEDAGAAGLTLSGYLRGMYVYGRSAGALVQTADRCRYGASSSAGTRGGILLRGDCTTAYPGAAAIAPAGGGMVAVPRAWITPTTGGPY